MTLKSSVQMGYTLYLLSHMAKPYVTGTELQNIQQCGEMYYWKRV